jgi:hypothetical protein
MSILSCSHPLIFKQLSPRRSVFRPSSHASKTSTSVSYPCVARSLGSSNTQSSRQSCTRCRRSCQTSPRRLRGVIDWSDRYMSATTRSAKFSCSESNTELEHYRSFSTVDPRRGRRNLRALRSRQSENRKASVGQTISARQRDQRALPPSGPHACLR